ncbi:hypothetical protein L3X38_018179 [Prunus dulcis]|uniref:Protein kinase domain-containing protein n=1 Tax=Prunus dulcis TaxID=3755 RepID=A0AAD4WAI1_PRUDU|nr:hypothetical protein L3X38_018179 [Prunus dulcis]
MASSIFSPGQSLSGNQTITSTGSIFELGFFTPAVARLGYNKLTKEKLFLMPWRTSSDPAPGLFYLELQQNGTSFWLLWNDSETYWTSGYWTGKLFSLVPEMAENDYISNFTLASNENGSYFTYADASSNTFIRIMLEITASATRRMSLFVAVCKDLNPKSQKIGNYKITNGCVRKTPLQCNDVRNSSFACLIWKGDLFNLKQLASAGKRGHDWHVRVAGSEKDQIIYSANKKKRETAWIVIGVLAGLFFVLSVVMVMFRRKQSVGALDTVEKQFHAEVRTIGAIQHINLVRLQGFCAEASKRLLVYEYMPNGSLHSLLLPKNPLILDWKARYHIAIGTAKGVQRLHHTLTSSLITFCWMQNTTRNLEILLDGNCSRVLTTMRGTPGYLAPEWFSGEAITPKADVFSYGMLLIEVISGRRNRDGFDDGI